MRGTFVVNIYHSIENTLIIACRNKNKAVSLYHNNKANNNPLKFKIMTHYKAIVTEKTAPNYGEIIANTKSSLKYKGMNKEQFAEATKHISCFTISIIEC